MFSRIQPGKAFSLRGEQVEVFLADAVAGKAKGAVHDVVVARSLTVDLHFDAGAAVSVAVDRGGGGR